MKPARESAVVPDRSNLTAGVLGKSGKAGSRLTIAVQSRPRVEMLLDREAGSGKMHPPPESIGQTSVSRLAVIGYLQLSMLLLTSRYSYRTPSLSPPVGHFVISEGCISNRRSAGPVLPSLAKETYRHLTHLHHAYGSGRPKHRAALWECHFDMFRPRYSRNLRMTICRLQVVNRNVNTCKPAGHFRSTLKTTGKDVWVLTVITTSSDVQEYRQVPSSGNRALCNLELRRGNSSSQPPRPRSRSTL